MCNQRKKIIFCLISYYYYYYYYFHLGGLLGTVGDPNFPVDRNGMHAAEKKNKQEIPRCGRLPSLWMNLQLRRRGRSLEPTSHLYLKLHTALYYSLRCEDRRDVEATKLFLLHTPTSTKTIGRAYCQFYIMIRITATTTTAAATAEATTTAKRKENTSEEDGGLLAAFGSSESATQKM